MNQGILQPVFLFAFLSFCGCEAILLMLNDVRVLFEAISERLGHEMVDVFRHYPSTRFIYEMRHVMPYVAHKSDQIVKVYSLNQQEYKLNTS